MESYKCCSKKTTRNQQTAYYARIVDTVIHLLLIPHRQLASWALNITSKISLNWCQPTSKNDTEG